MGLRGDCSGEDDATGPLWEGSRSRRSQRAGSLAIGLLICACPAEVGTRAGPPLPHGEHTHTLSSLWRTSREHGEDAVPNRLGVAVEAAGKLAQSLGADAGNRVAIVAFAGRGCRRRPLTENLGVAPHGASKGSGRATSNRVEPTWAPGLDAAIEAFDAQDHSEGRTIVLFSDGEDHAQTWTGPARSSCARRESSSDRGRLTRPHRHTVPSGQEPPL